jgi:hypothetical protein
MSYARGKPSQWRFATKNTMFIYFIYNCNFFSEERNAK